MYYKVIKNNKVIDVLDHLTYLKWQKKNKIMLLSDLNEAQAILGSDNNTIWHVEGLYDLPVEAGKYDTVKLIEVDKYEYDKLKMLNLSTPEEIIDRFLLTLLENNII
jgi:hypothetical protein